MDMKALERDIEELLTRGVGAFIDPDTSFKKKLIEKVEGKYTKPIIIKFGVDPTRPDLHLGHAVVLRKLRKFQDYGCKVVFLIGDFTSLIGDPSGKSKVRPEIADAEIKANMKTYLEQVGKILITDNPQVFSWIGNADWFTDITDIISSPGSITITDSADPKKSVNVDANSFIGKAAIFEKTRMQVTNLGHKKNIQGITLRTFISVLRYITHAQLIERDMFQDRLTTGTELYMHEMMYPILQAIDSVVLHNIYGSCDLEVGGTDQHFNMLMGRTVMKLSKLPEQAVLSFKLLEGLDGKEKMSKSLNNYIEVTDTPHDMYGKVMSIPDSSLLNYFELTTFTPMDEIEKMKKELAEGSVNPRDYKMNLARQIVSMYHGTDKAHAAEENFVTTFKKGGVPEDVETVEVRAQQMLMDVVLEKKIVSSKTEWKRLIGEGAVQNITTQEKIEDPLYIIAEDGVYKIGKRRFIKIVIK